MSMTMVEIYRAIMPYMALSILRKATDTASSMDRSTARSSLPIGSQAKGSLSSRAIRSVPPVVAPLEKMIPRDSPRLTPPKMAASMGSIGGKVYTAEIRSTSTEVAAMAKREDTRV